MMTPADAAKRACVSTSLIYAWVGSGRLRHYRMGRQGRRGKIVIEEADFESFLQSLKVSERVEIEEGELKFID